MSVVIRRIERPDLGVVRELRLRALKTDPTSFGSTYEREAAFAAEVWEERVGPERKVTTRPR